MNHSYHRYKSGDRLRLQIDPATNRPVRRPQGMSREDYEESLPIYGHFSVVEPGQVDSTVDSTDTNSHSYFSYDSLSYGNYILQCACGSPYVTKHISIINAELNRKSKMIYSCGCQAEEWERLYKKPMGRKPGLIGDSQVRIVPGDVIGRLLLNEWVPGRGWKCYCSMCGEEEYVRYTSKLKYVGSRICPVVADSGGDGTGLVGAANWEANRHKWADIKL